MTLVDADMLDALAETAELGMASTVEIYRKADAINDFSDDAESYPEDPDETVAGWLRVQPDHDLTVERGAVVHSEEARLFVPRAVTLSRGDKIVVSGEAFYVVDVNTHNTYRVLTRAALRRLD